MVFESWNKADGMFWKDMANIWQILKVVGNKNWGIGSTGLFILFLAILI